MNNEVFTIMVGTFVLQQGDQRPWMKTEITFTENGDISYFRLRSILPDLTETVISWSEVQTNITPPGQEAEERSGSHEFRNH